MMKMIMKTAPTQVPGFIFGSGSTYGKIWAITSGLGSVKLQPFLSAGYRSFDFMMIGCAGGHAGDCIPNPNNRTYNCAYGAAGGGGASLRVKGKIKDIAAASGNTMFFGVGSEGTDGGNSGDAVRAGAGTTGGDAFVGPYIAHGGAGAIGGYINVNASGDAFTGQASVGGAGGSNSQNWGAGGTGGRGGDLGGPAEVAAGQGTWVDQTNGQGGGKGGGGGSGNTRFNGVAYGGSHSGASGSVGGDGTHDGAGTTYADSRGGTGGGGDPYSWYPNPTHEEHGGGGQTGFAGFKMTMV